VNNSLVEPGKMKADSKPTVLVAATSQWFPTARLATALAKAGFVVHGVCPPGHPMCKTHAVTRVHVYNGLAPVRTLARAIEAAKPALIIPGDDLSTRHLHQLYKQELGQGGRGSQTCTVIERSFGSPESFPVVYERAAFMQLAQEEGVRVPETKVILDLEELRRWTQQSGFPFVLKANGTSGGDGVRVVRTVDEAERAFVALQAPPLVARAAKRALLDKDCTLVWPSLLRRRLMVNAQVFVDGHEATSTVACWDGEVLASLHCEVIQKKYSAGPATVIRLVENSDMSNAVAKMVKRLKLSGVHGFDFMLETNTSNAYLIEINPRTTQVGHLTLGESRDIPAALYAAITESVVQPAKPLTQGDTIALFPQEWMRDPSSPILQSVYHDVPWEEPELLRECIDRGLKQISSNNKQKLESLRSLEKERLNRLEPTVLPAKASDGMMIEQTKR
jgi:hypothetical protein